MKQFIFRSLPRMLAFICFILTGLLGANNALALTFPLPAPGDSVVGHIQWTRAMPGDTFSTIGRRFDIGYYELVEANPGVDPQHITPGTLIVVPSEFILPAVPRQGIVVSLAELRVYYYPPYTNTVVTFPVGVGREGWSTPMGITHIVEKIVNPVWVVPESIKEDRASQGVVLPNSVAPGPEDPLGGYAMRLGIQQQTYLMHGSNDYTGIGRRSSSGCIRMWPEDIEALFAMVPKGTQVNIIEDAYKAGWRQDKLYLEAHVPLQEQQADGTAGDNAMRAVVQSALTNHVGTVYWDTAERIANQQNGVPQIIGTAQQ